MVQDYQKLIKSNLKSLKIQDLNNYFEESDNWEEEKEIIGKRIIELLYDCGAIKTWYRDRKEGWILRSELWSPVYISFRDISSNKNFFEIFTDIGISITKLINNEISKCDKLLGVATTGILIAFATSMFSKIPFLYTRKIETGININDFETLIKEYGEHKLIEGEFEDNDNIVIIDDLVTRLGTTLFEKKKLEYLARKRNKNIQCKDIVVILDREQGASKTAIDENVKLHSLIPFKSKLYWLKDRFADIEYQIIKEYFEDSSKFQEPNKIKEIVSLAK